MVRIQVESTKKDKDSIFLMNMQQQREQKLIKAFDPIHLEVIDESHEHKMPRGSQMHFRAVVVSEFFMGKTRIERHKKVYRALLKELDGLIKTFTVLTFDTRQWKGKECTLPLPPALDSASQSSDTIHKIVE